MYPNDNASANSFVILGHHDAGLSSEDTQLQTHTDEDGFEVVTKTNTAGKPTVFYHIRRSGNMRGAFNSAILVPRGNATEIELEGARSAYAFSLDIRGRNEARRTEYLEPGSYCGGPLSEEATKECIEETYRDILDTRQKRSGASSFQLVEIVDDERFKDVRQIISRTHDRDRATVVVGVVPGLNPPRVDDMLKFRVYTHPTDSCWDKIPGVMYPPSEIEDCTTEGKEAAKRLYNGTGGASRCSQRNTWDADAGKLMNVDREKWHFTHATVSAKTIDWLKIQPFNFLEEIDGIPDRSSYKYSPFPYE